MPHSDIRSGSGKGWTLSERPLLRLLTLCILYVAQGIPWGVVTVTLVIYLSAAGLEAGAIGAFTAMATLPWTFKWVWGPLIDRYGIPSMGRRRPWILLAQAGMITTIAMMAFVPSLTADVVLLGWMVLIHNVFNSLQDVAVDALAVRNTTATSERTNMRMTSDNSFKPANSLGHPCPFDIDRMGSTTQSFHRYACELTRSEAE